MLVILFFLFLSLIESKVSDWLYYPKTNNEKVEYGIITGATSNYFTINHKDLHSDSIYTSCLFLLYAKKHNYAYYINQNLGQVNNRSYGDCSSERMSPWNKIILIKQLLDDVNYLVWIDIDTVLDEISFRLPITSFLPTIPLKSQLDCLPRYTNQSSTRQYGEFLQSFSLSELPGRNKEPFLFASEDLSSFYPININTAIFIIKNNQLAFEFLDDVWKVGDNPNYFKSLDNGWKKKFPCQGYWGWPWEQGGIWQTLMDYPKKYLNSICILSRSNQYVLNNIHGDPEILSIYADPLEFLNRSGYQIIFGYHHSKINGRHVLKRLMRTKLTTSKVINQTCNIFLAPVLILDKPKYDQKTNQKKFLRAESY